MTRPKAGAAPKSAGRARRGAVRAPPRVTTGHVYVADPEYADLCAKELGLKQEAVGADGVLCVTASRVEDAAFAHQLLPHARLLRGAGPNDLAAVLLEGVAALLPAGLAIDPTRVSVSAPELPRRMSHAREPHPLHAAAVALADTLDKKIRGRAIKHAQTGPLAHHRVRVLVVDTWSAWLSISDESKAPLLVAWPSPLPGGVLIDEAARDAPSSAWRKIVEAVALLEDGPAASEVVVDLGAAPGGWTRVMVERGATVIAVDRADLDADLARHPRVSHVRADAFTFATGPQVSPVHWWLCDVIDKPERALELAAYVLALHATRGLVFTLKLTRPLDLTIIKHARRLAQTPGYLGRVKHLRANKLEVTLLMRRTSSS